MRVQRNTATRDKHRRLIEEGLSPSPFGPKPPCYHCGEPIDYDADHLDPLSYQVDHLIPITKGGPDTLDNKVPSHRKCNRAKSDKLGPPQIGVTFITDRDWWSNKSSRRGRR